MKLNSEHFFKLATLEIMQYEECNIFSDVAPITLTLGQ